MRQEGHWPAWAWGIWVLQRRQILVRLTPGLPIDIKQNGHLLNAARGSGLLQWAQLLRARRVVILLAPGN